MKLKETLTAMRTRTQMANINNSEMSFILKLNTNLQSGSKKFSVMKSMITNHRGEVVKVAPIYSNGNEFARFVIEFKNMDNLIEFVRLVHHTTFVTADVANILVSVDNNLTTITNLDSIDEPYYTKAVKARRKWDDFTKSL